MSEEVSSSLQPQETFALPALLRASAPAHVEETTSRENVRSALRPQETLWGRYKKHTGGVIGLLVVVLLTGLACLAPVLAPQEPFSLGDMALSEPSSLHLMGTDHLGRDILSAVLWGLRVSLLVGVCAALIAVALGICIGGSAGYFGGHLDNLLMRATDAFMVLPTFFLVLIVVAIFGGSLWKLIALIGLTNWPPVARLVRAEFLSLRERDFALAAKAVGAGPAMIMVRHILPNALPVIIPTLSLRTAGAIITEASLSFLGVGDPNVISLGQMLINALQFMRMAWWTAMFPGLTIFVIVLALNLVGDGLNDACNPRLKSR
jgi:peptide/nickel transport system permease protein